MASGLRHTTWGSQEAASQRFLHVSVAVKCRTRRGGRLGEHKNQMFDASLPAPQPRGTDEWTELLDIFSCVCSAFVFAPRSWVTHISFGKLLTYPERYLVYDPWFLLDYLIFTHTQLVLQPPRHPIKEQLRLMKWCKTRGRGSFSPLSFIAFFLYTPTLHSHDSGLHPRPCPFKHVWCGRYEGHNDFVSACGLADVDFMRHYSFIFF